VLADVSGANCAELGDPVWMHVPGAALRVFASPLP
jgi:hypothetical protein